MLGFRINLLAILIAAITGCSGGAPRVEPPEVDSVAAGKAAVAQYDVNRDGLIGDAELDQAPAIKAAIANLDKQGDGQVSSQEITDRINAWTRSRDGLIPLPMRVTLDGSPLVGATITVIPEKFLGPNWKPAKGVTGPQGIANCSVEGQDPKKQRLFGVAPGLYRVEIVAKDNDALPVRYNKESTLGAEVARDAEWARTGLKFELNSDKPSQENDESSQERDPNSSNP